jgi:hypothetical protein
LTITVRDVIVLRGPPFILAFIAKCASGVLPSSWATGVGHKPDSLSDVRGANVRSSYNVPLRIEPDRGKVSEHDIESPNNESCDVFHQQVAGS